jgi:uncharacterized protein
MYLDDGELTISASDLVGFLACRHLTWQGTRNLTSGGKGSWGQGPMARMQAEMGLAHERAYLQSLHDAQIDVEEIDDSQPLTERVADTEAALREGRETIYQATFVDEVHGVKRRGHADFLKRIDTPSDLGEYGYEPVDTKLTSHLKADAVVQLASYAEQLARLQGTLPDAVHVQLGSGEYKSVRLRDVDAYYRRAVRRLVDGLEMVEEPYPVPTSHCAYCRFRNQCEQRRLDDDHLSLVAFLTSEQRRTLEAAGITTMAALAAHDPAERAPGMNATTLSKLCQQARLQCAAEPDQPPPYELLPVEAGLGLSALPEPDPGDVYYDIEGHPFRLDGGLEYLHGIGTVDTGEFVFDGWWAHTSRAEREVFERFIDFVIDRRFTYPNLHVYHYAPYETTAVKRLMGRYGTREADVDQLLRDGVFVDLYRVVRQGVRVGSPSYSIKRLEALYMPEREGGIDAGVSSIVVYDQWCREPDQSLLDAIEVYNRQDVESLWHLQGWAEDRRRELVDAGEDVPRPTGPEPIEGDEPATDDTADLVAELTHDLDEDLEDPTEDQRTRWLMADLLHWHRREDKPKWWWYFARRDTYDDDDFLEDSECIGGLELVGPVPGSTGNQWRYRFDPSQECKVRPGDFADAERLRAKAVMPDGDAPGAGQKVIAIDVVVGTVDVQRAVDRAELHPRNLMPASFINNGVLRRSLQRSARRLLDGGIDGAGPSTAVVRLLAGCPPKVHGLAGGTPLRVPADRDLLDTMTGLCDALDVACLPVQGPPGSGKTFAAARVILHLVRQGHVVGITALSHSAIGNVITAVIEAAEGSPVRIVQKADDGRGIEHPWVSLADNKQVIEELDAGAQIVAGTPWLFARPELEGRLHTLFVDEAGQLSLANVVAAGTAGQNLVLVGDPQQLSQPSQGVHPPGAGVSALEHVLGGHRVLPDDRGLLLDRTWRMHPDITAFISEQVYEGRLSSVASTAQQHLEGSDPLAGAGLRWVPVEHEGCSTSSAEEVARIVELYEALQGRTWFDDTGSQCTIGADEVLVVAPYNAQVHELVAALPTGARVGTVDRFQGQEAAVVIVSMTASSAEDVPRGIEFLYSRNRLNVAVSRAKVLSIMVASPALLSVRCHTLEQLQLANVLCRYVELADVVE